MQIRKLIELSDKKNLEDLNIKYKKLLQLKKFDKDDYSQLFSRFQFSNKMNTRCYVLQKQQSLGINDENLNN
jgi:hypothetical protein